MASLNKVFLIGNLTRDPELRYTPQGTAVASFGLASNRRWKSSDGQDKEETLFVDITAFGRQAEIVSEYMSKGRPIFVEGRLKLDQWQDKESGAKRSKLTVIVESFQFLGGGPGASGASGESGEGRRQPRAKPEARQESQEDAGAAPADNDIPF
jgi:single-strand DNA-binding protein